MTPPPLRFRPVAPLLAVALLSAACSSEPADTPDRTPTPVPSSSATPVAAPPRTSKARDSNVRPTPGDLKTFGDWTVGCDNVRHCAMASLGPEAGDFPPLTIAVERDAGPSGTVAVRVLAGSAERAAADALEVDGRRFALADDRATGTVAANMAEAMAAGRHLSIVGQDGGRQAVSLAGASAALRYIDAQQGRAGTVTAIVARGGATAATVPAPAPLPDVVALAPARTSTTPDAAQLRAMRRIGACEERMADAAIWTPRTQTYADGATLVLLPCSAGAYNEIDAVFVLRDGRVSPADIDAEAGFEPTGADSRTPVRSVINGEFDAGQLTSFAKARGLGDCGSAQRFAWDGRRLRLVEQTFMSECRGNPHYLTIWRARAVRP